MNEPKLCRDCVHFARYVQGVQNRGEWFTDRCKAPPAMTFDAASLVDGMPPNAVSIRSTEDLCGIEGKLYVKAPPAPAPPPPPVPPPLRSVCVACGPLKDGERHRSYACRLVIALDRDHPEHAEQKRLGGIFGRPGGIVGRGK